MNNETPDTKKITGKTTQFGFQWGAAEVLRCFEEEKNGSVTLEIRTARGDIQVYVTKTGKIRVHSDTGEWLPKNPKSEPLCR